jgi:hypothetical protein
VTIADDIRELLELAGEHDQAAREARKSVGRILAALREETPIMRWRGELARPGLDYRTAEVLIRMATGAEAP